MRSYPAYSNPAYEALLNEVCGCGFCGSIVDGKPLHVDMFIPERGTVGADEFVQWLVKAEGLDPIGLLSPKRTLKGLRDAFVRHMGSEIVEAQALK